MKILFISPLSPPNGGIGTWTKILLEEGLPPGFDFRIVNSSVLGNRIIFESRINFFCETLRTLRIIINLLIKLCFYRPQIVHLNSSTSLLALFQK